MSVTDEYEVLTLVPRINFRIGPWPVRLFFRDGAPLDTFDSMIGAKQGIVKVLEKPGHKDDMFRIRIRPVGLQGKTKQPNKAL